MPQPREPGRLTFKDTSSEVTTIVGGRTVTKKSRQRELMITNEVTQVLVMILVMLITALAGDEMRSVVSATWALLSG